MLPCAHVNLPLWWKASAWQTVKIEKTSIHINFYFRVLHWPTEIHIFTHTGLSWEGREALPSYCALRDYRLRDVKCTPHSLLLTLQELWLFTCSLPSAHIWLHCPTLTLHMCFKKEKADTSKTQSFWWFSCLNEAQSSKGQIKYIGNVPLSSFVTRGKSLCLSVAPFPHPWN